MVAHKLSGREDCWMLLVVILHSSGIKVLLGRRLEELDLEPDLSDSHPLNSKAHISKVFASVGTKVENQIET
jgi:hypothetical protein